MKLTQVLFFLLCTNQSFGFMLDREIIEYVDILSETKLNFIRLKNLNQAVVKDLVTHYPIELLRPNKSQELNTITLCRTFCETEINHLSKYVLLKNILIVKLSTSIEEM